MESVWFLTVVFNGHVSLTSLVVNDESGSAIDQAIDYIGEKFTPYGVHTTLMQDVRGNTVNGYCLVNPVLKASLIKA